MFKVGKRPERVHNAAKSLLTILYKIKPNRYDGLYFISTGEDKCQDSKDKCEVSKDKHEDQRKMEYFHEAINSTNGRKGKSKPPLGGVYKDVKVEEARGTILFTLRTLCT